MTAKPRNIDEYLARLSNEKRAMLEKLPSFPRKRESRNATKPLDSGSSPE